MQQRQQQHAVAVVVVRGGGCGDDDDANGRRRRRRPTTTTTVAAAVRRRGRRRRSGRRRFVVAKLSGAVVVVVLVGAFVAALLSTRSFSEESRRTARTTSSGSTPTPQTTPSSSSSSLSEKKTDLPYTNPNLRRYYDSMVRYPILFADNSTTTTTTTTAGAGAATTINSNAKAKVRVLLFEHASRRISFRRDDAESTTWAVSDEVLNICLDGFRRSPGNFRVPEPPTVIVPDFHDEPEFVIREEQDDDGGGDVDADSQQQQQQQQNRVVWVVDMRRMLLHKPYSIPEQLLYAVNGTLASYERNQQQQHRPQRPPLRLDVVLFDWRDRIGKPLCAGGAIGRVRELLSSRSGGGGGGGTVRYVVQQVAIRRRYDADRGFARLGKVRTFQENDECLSYPPLQVPYAVRSDYAEAVLAEYRKYLPSKRPSSSYDKLVSISNDIKDWVCDRLPGWSMPGKTCRTQQQSWSSTSTATPAHTVRQIDVAHFWSYRDGNGSVQTQLHARLRDSVTRTLEEMMSNWTLAVPGGGRRSLNVLADTVSASGNYGRTSISAAYLEALLTSKIVVVAQRDSYEDHYRFFEAVVGGALVLTDPMLSLPQGFVNGTNVVTYSSLDELKRTIMYYLDRDDERIGIARAGYDVAMRYHRTYHWMERLFFGSAMTP